MTVNLSTVRDQLEQRLQDSSNLIFSTTAIDEALRAALADLSTTNGAALTLEDLDSATATTIPDLDINCFIVGGVAYALRFRLIQRFDQAFPTREDPDDLAKAAADQMQHFQSMLTLVKLRLFSSSEDHPYSQWEWEEGSDFT